MNKIKITQTIASNIQRYRKLNKLTQLELATKLNYSDKTVSKWERGEGVPDIYVLTEIANFFGLTVDDLLDDHPPVVPINTKQKKHLMITLSAFAGVWLVAIVYYALSIMLGYTMYAWISFIIALPISFIVLIVFASLWGGFRHSIYPSSLLIWSLALTFTLLIKVQNSYLFFIIAIPVQILMLLIFFVTRFRKKEKLFLDNSKEN